MNNVLITICARGGSKGIPGKNIKLLGNRPLLHYTLLLALQLKEKKGWDIQLSSDSKEIINCAHEIGYHTDYIRPERLATDIAGKIGVIKDAFMHAENNNNKQYDYVIDLDVTSPLRTMMDIEVAFENLKINKSALNIFSVNPASRNPYFNMVEEKKDGFVKVVKDTDGYLTRQEAPKVYDMNASFYIFTREYMLGNYKSSITPKSLIYVMPHICFDLDEKHDFQIMEVLLKEKIIDFL